MTWVDWSILAVIATSMAISIFRGLTREVLSLLAWVAAGWVSLHYSPVAADWLAPWIPVPSMRLLLAGAAIFTVTLLVLGIFNLLIGQLIRSSGLSGTDRSLGMVFGFARGVAIVTVLVLGAGLTAVPEDPWWQEALLLDHFEDLAVEAREFLPEPVAGLVRYPEERMPGEAPFLPLTAPFSTPSTGATPELTAPRSPEEPTLQR
jgi:membrane protein required for colicin V production